MNAKDNDSSFATKGTVRLPGLKLMTGLGRSTIYARLDSKSPSYDCEFPRPIALGERARGWFVAEIETWLASRPRTCVIHDRPGQLDRKSEPQSTSSNRDYETLDTGVSLDGEISKPLASRSQVRDVDVKEAV